MTWEGTGEVPNFCPEGCGGITEDVYGGPCKDCWAEVDRRERARDEEPERCAWCHRGVEQDILFCGEECAEAYEAEWGDND
jgi:predicted NAD/FAD-binding protein